VSAPTAHGHPDRGDLPPPETVEIAEGVFAYVQPDGSWWINNTGFVVGSDGVTAIDTCATERRSAAFLQAMAAVSPRPVRTLVNTHHHGDHTNGNCLFEAALILGHSNCRHGVLEATIGGLDAAFGPVDWGNLRIAPPTVTFDDSLVLHVDDIDVEVCYAGGPAHTTGDVVAWLPRQGVLYAGDLVFNGGTPFVLMGSVAGSMRALEWLRQFPATTIVPGHGGLCGPDQLEDVAGYLAFVQDLAAEARAGGLRPLDAARQADLGPYADLLDSERLVGNLHRAYAELDGHPPGHPIDIAAAFADMIAFNGGRPLRCLA
jgi:cyclase